MATNSFSKTPDQIKALNLLSNKSRYTLLFGGSRSGKTFILVYAIMVRALRVPNSRHIILRYRGNAVRQSVRLDTFEKVRKLAFPHLRFKSIGSDQYVKFSNGSEIWFGGLDSDERVEKILGKEFATIYFNECSEIDYSAVVIALTRLAQLTALTNKAYFDCNPSGKSHWSYRLFIEKCDPESGNKIKFPENYTSMLMNPNGNRKNLPEGYIEETLAGLTERQRRRFELGEWLDDMNGALWNQKIIDKNRVTIHPELLRIIVGVDPAVSSGDSADSTGIVTVGVASNGEYYVLNDASLIARPAKWAKVVCDEYYNFKADRVVGEVNNGGELIECVLRNIAPEISYKAVHAIRGKVLRAEPIAALYEQNKVHHVGIFPELERQMTGFTINSPYSPDRLDALVWAITILMETPLESKFIL